MLQNTGRASSAGRQNRDPASRDEARAILEEKPGEREAVLKKLDPALKMADLIAFIRVGR